MVTRSPAQDPIVDCFARVENIPQSVLRKTADKAIWRKPKEYLEHLDRLPLAANMAPFLPHSMLRIEVMGLQDSISRQPTKAELQQMVGILEEAMDDGYLGLSTDGLPLHFLANAPNTAKRIPTQYASTRNTNYYRCVAQTRSSLADDTATDDGGLTARCLCLAADDCTVSR